jgi:hypothetical protein
VIITKKNESKYLRDKPVEYVKGWRDAIKGEHINADSLKPNNYIEGYTDSVWNSESYNSRSFN